VSVATFTDRARGGSAVCVGISALPAQARISGAARGAWRAGRRPGPPGGGRWCI